MKRLLIIMTLLFSLVTVASAAENDLTNKVSLLNALDIIEFTEQDLDKRTMIVNGQAKPVDPDSIQTTPKIVQDRTMIPVRALIETIGGIVDWNEETQTVTMTVNGKTLKMTIGSDIAKFGDSELLLEVAPLVINGRTMFPARFIVETFGGGISWNSNKREVQMSFYK